MRSRLTRTPTEVACSDSRGLGALYLDEPDAFESASLDLEEREVGMAGAVVGSTTRVLGGFGELISYPAPGPSGYMLASKGERLALGV